MGDKRRDWPLLLAASFGALSTTAMPRAADDVRVLSAAAVQVPVEALAAPFMADTGHHVTFEFATAGQVDAKLKAGATPDVVITSAERAAAIEPDARWRHPLGTVRMGVAARPGAPRPELSTVESFTASLQRAERIAYGDPAGGSTTGIHFAKVFATLPFAPGPRPTVVLGANGLDVMQRVARGEVDLGITQISEILHVAADTLVGPLPDALQLSTTYVAVVRPQATPAAAALIERLTDARGVERFRAAGFR